VRRISDAPVIVVGHERDETTAINVLDAGADDYVVLPGSADHLLAHVRAVLRRLRPASREQRQVFQAGPLTVDLGLRRLFMHGREVRLSATEWQLLAALVSCAGQLLLHEEILTRAWGPEYRHDRQYLRVWIRRLRQKLNDEGTTRRYIRTVPGMGYLFEATT
jgi:two-component system KDP operon response regulator KdpE